MSCANCGTDEKGEGISLKACKSCMLVKYCNPTCQRNHWPKHKKPCKQRAAELRDEALSKDPPPKEDCPICFLPMPGKLINCVSLPPATLSFVPIYVFAVANEGFAQMETEEYFTCCGKCICKGCVHVPIEISTPYSNTTLLAIFCIHHWKVLTKLSYEDCQQRLTCAAVKKFN